LSETIITDLTSIQTLAEGSKPLHGGSKFWVIAASGKAVWKPDGDRLLHKISSTTAQWALTMNGMTYTQLAALTPFTELGGGQVLAYSNQATQDGMNIFIPEGTELTLSVSSSGTQWIMLFWDFL
jgi:hypothetical protein